MQQLQATPNNVFLQPEFSTTAVPIALGASGTMALQSNGAGSNTALLTFTAAHGYTATLQPNGSTLIQNPTTNHVPPITGGTNLNTTPYICMQLTGATGNTAVNALNLGIIAIPSTTTMLLACPVSGANPVVTAASVIPVFILQMGSYNFTLGPNCAAQYNPDNTGSPYTSLSVSSSVVPAPAWRNLMLASTSGQLDIEGLAGQTVVIANGGAGTSRWSIYFR